MRWTLPTPLHWEQVTGSVPGAQHEPSQAVQVTYVSMGTDRVAPKATSESSTSTATRASWPRRAREAGPRLAAPPPKKDWKMPPRSPKSAPAKPPPNPPPPRTASSPPRSYIWRLSASERTS